MGRRLVSSFGIPTFNTYTDEPEIEYSEWVEERRNLCTNPSFESGLPPWSRSPSGGGSSSHSTDYSSSGSYAARVVTTTKSTASGDFRNAYLETFPEGIAAGDQIAMTANIMLPTAYISSDSSAGSRQRRAMFFMQNAGGSFTSSYGAQAPNTPGEHTISHSSVIPVEATGIIYAVGCAGSPSDSNFVAYVDSVIIEIGSTTGEYFDGDTYNEELRRTRWLGEPHNSISVLETRARIN